ncbi:MAG: hypothetical protein WKG07_43385 [Hymenobacter sp.]
MVAKYWFEKLHTAARRHLQLRQPRAYHDPNQPGYNQGRTPSFQAPRASAPSYLTHLAGQFTVVHLAVERNVLGRDNTLRLPLRRRTRCRRTGQCAAPCRCARSCRK